MKNPKLLQFLRKALRPFSGYFDGDRRLTHNVGTTGSHNQLSYGTDSLKFRNQLLVSRTKSVVIVPRQTQ